MLFFFMKKNKWKVIFKGDLDEFDSLCSLKYWENKSSTEKFKETTSLINNALKIKGKSIKDVSRLLRTTAVLKRQ